MTERELEREERLREMGLAPLWRSRLERVAQSAEDSPAATGLVANTASPIAAPSQPLADVPVADFRAEQIAARSWDELPSHIAACTACGLCRSRTKTVP